MATIDYKRVADAQGITKAVYDDIMRTYGSPEPHGIYQLMGHTPDFLEASWARSKYLFGNDSQFTLRDKHILTLGISATNNCEYCVRIHTNRLVGLGMNASQLTELMGVVDVTNGLAKFCEGTRAGDRPVIAEYAVGDGDPEADKALRELGNEKVDSLYAIMARWPAFLRLAWQQAKLCFGEDGTLGVKLKHMVGFCIAATSGADHLIDYHARRLKELGTTDRAFIEMLLIIDLTCGYNRYVQGLQADQETKPFGEGAEADRAASCGGPAIRPS
jgi:AhpD family alkylhydroperoxidase